MRIAVRATAVLGALALVVAPGITACGDGNNSPLDGSVDSVTLAPPGPVVIQMGDMVHFSASVHGGPGLTDRAVMWSSSNTAVVIVDQTGVVKAVAGGTASIVAASQAKPSISGVAVVAVALLPPAAVRSSVSRQKLISQSKQNATISVPPPNPGQLPGFPSMSRR
jgi:uncharacterized protein YjdB